MRTRHPGEASDWLPWTAFTATKAQPERVIACFLHDLEQEGHRVSRAEFERNLLAKRDDPRFIADIIPLVVTHGGFDLPQATWYSPGLHPGVVFSPRLSLPRATTPPQEAGIWPAGLRA